MKNKKYIKISAKKLKKLHDGLANLGDTFNLDKEVAKKSKSMEWEIFLIPHIKWEFVRRNPEYKKDYEEWLDRITPTWEKPEDLYDKIGEKWGFPPIDYRLPLKKKHSVVAKWMLDKKYYEQCKRYMDDKYFSYFDSWGSLVMINWLSKDAMEYPFKLKGKKLSLDEIKFNGQSKDNRENCEGIKTINLSINLLYPKDQILYAVNRFIDNFKKMSKVSYIKSRKRMQKYLDCLKIYDLRQDGKTFPQIVNKLYSNSSTAYDTLLNQVQREYRRAAQLINGGYRQIR